MAVDLTGKYALVTGSGRGIGAETARLLASRGARILLTSRTLLELEELAKEISETSPVVLSGDIGDSAFLSELAKTVESEFGRLDILVNNAGLAIHKPFSEFEMKEFDQVLRINLGSVFELTQRLLPLMSQGALVVNMSSLAGVSGVEKFPGFSAYSAAKAGVIGLSECLAAELSERGIRVNCIAPGAVDTKMLRDLFPDFKTSTKSKDVAEKVLEFIDRPEANGEVMVLDNA